MHAIQNCFGDTGIQVWRHRHSGFALGFGCGDVGGLMVRGTVQERVDAVARALDAGITYFDTASMYGRGQSEINLGAALRQLKETAVIGTKARLMPDDLADIKAGVVRSVEASLARLGSERVDLIQLHNQLSPRRGTDIAVLTTEDAMEVADAFETLHREGKVGAWGITALGHTATLHAGHQQRSVQHGADQLQHLEPKLRRACPGPPSPPGLREAG